MSKLAITSKLGIVHKVFPANPHLLCDDMREAVERQALGLDAKIVEVTPLQAYVFNLAPCTRAGCWYNVTEYDRLIGRRRNVR